MSFIKTLAIGTLPLLIAAGSLAVLVSQPTFTSFKSGSAIQHASPERLQQHVQFLASATVPRSYPKMENLNRAADYIHNEFAKSGADVSEQIFLVEKQSFKNIIAAFGPDTTERIVIGAHYDSYGGFPGADDNASGVAGLLELAGLLSKTKQPMRVELVAYSLEEPPFFRTQDMGSMIHAAILRAKDVKVRAMICLEMIGYFSDKPGSQRYPAPGMGLIYPDQADFIAVVGSLSDIGLVRKVKRAMIQASDLPVRSINAPAAVPGIDFSDHLSYWQQGYPAVMISDTAFYRNRNYHHSTDLPDTLDYKRMGKVVDQVYAAVSALSD